MNSELESPAFAQVIAMVADLKGRAEQIAAALRALREPEAADLVARLVGDAGRAEAGLRALLECTPRQTDWYQVHRDMWIRYGDLGDLAAMGDHVTPAR